MHHVSNIRKEPVLREALQTLAEQTAWKLAKELDLDLVAVLPSIVMGPAYAARSSFSYDIMQVPFFPLI